MKVLFNALCGVLMFPFCVILAVILAALTLIAGPFIFLYKGLEGIDERR